MDRPESRWKRSELNALDAPSLDERYWILEVVVGVLRTIGSEDYPRGHRLAVNSLDDAKLVRPNFDKRNLAYNLFKRVLDKVQTALHDVGLYSHLAFGRDNSSC